MIKSTQVLDGADSTTFILKVANASPLLHAVTLRLMRAPYEEHDVMRFPGRVFGSDESPAANRPLPELKMFYLAASALVVDVPATADLAETVAAAWEAVVIDRMRAAAVPVEVEGRGLTDTLRALHEAGRGSLLDEAGINQTAFAAPEQDVTVWVAPSDDPKRTCELARYGTVPVLRTSGDVVMYFAPKGVQVGVQQHVIIKTNPADLADPATRVVLWTDTAMLTPVFVVQEG